MQRPLILFLLALLLNVNVYAQHSPYIQAVDEYVPAPGQYINELPRYDEGDDGTTMALKCTEAIAHDAGGMVTLGAWGGYITFHFDHPVVNLSGQPDLYIKGNAFEGNSEPGIVCVSRDTNGNHLPDDVWYELSGSADVDSTNVLYGYELTYSLSASLCDVPWTDNQGNEGLVVRNNFHTQEYFPLWLPSSLTFSGTLLPSNASDRSGNGTYWTLESLRYGYVDNLSNKDTLACSFDIGWAVDPLTRQAVHLDAIDFVRVYTAVNQQAGWLGESSTEVCGAQDLHPSAVCSLPAVESSAIETLPTYDLQGRPTDRNHKHHIFINHQSKSIQL